MNKKIILMMFLLAAWVNSAHAIEDIITIFDDKRSEILFRKAAPIPNTIEGLGEAIEIVQKLKKIIKPQMPASSLAAPQIGISKQVFIYSWDRSWQNIEAVINPVVLEMDESKVDSWEACFSTERANGVSEAVFVKRPKRIRVEYTNLSGDRVEYILEGFAVKVFMHEYDHLQGIESASKEGANVRDFKSLAELYQFLENVKKKEMIQYYRPEFVRLKHE